MPEPTQDAVRERVVVAVQRLRAIGAMFPEANADADAIDALLAPRPTEPTPEQGRVERIERGMLTMWRDDATKVERWMGGAKSTYDRRTLDLVTAVRHLTDEVERLYNERRPTRTERIRHL